MTTSPATQLLASVDAALASARAQRAAWDAKIAELEAQRAWLAAHHNEAPDAV